MSSSDSTKLDAALRNATLDSALETLGQLIAGLGVRHAVSRGGDAVNPAWKKDIVYFGTRLC